MSVLVVRPSSTVVQGGSTSPSSAATVVTNLSDQSDLTFVTNTAVAVNRWDFGLTAPTIPADEYVARIGSSIRWKGNASGNYRIGCTTYRSTDTRPTTGALSYIYPNNSGAFASTEIGTSYVNWSVTDAATLRFQWYDGRNNPTFSTTQHAEAFASIYTIKRATTTCSTTSSTVSKPTFSCSTVGTIDWEYTATGGYGPLCSIGTQVWLEQGGTVPGTGTFIMTKSDTQTWTATQTRNISITSDTVIPNGTYRLYVRTIRYRNDGTTASDTIGAWSAGVTFTQNVPNPTAPTFTATADQTNDRVTLVATPITTSGYTLPTITIQRSEDSGTTWETVRGASGVAGAFGSASTFYDYESPRGFNVQYRAFVSATYTGGAINTSASSTVRTTNITADGWNLKCPQDPTLNDLNLTVVGEPTENITEDLGVFRPLSATYPIIVSGELTGWDGGLSVYCSSDAEWLSLKGLINAQKVLYLESPFGWAKYVRLIDGAKTRVLGTPTAPRRPVELVYVETSAP